MNTPTACTSLAEVRQEIDRLDRQIIAILRQRADYVRAAARFKSTDAEVAAPDRQQAMMRERRAWAEGEGLAPDFIEKLYREIVAYFIAREREHMSGDGTAGD